MDYRRHATAPFLAACICGFQINAVLLAADNGISIASFVTIESRISSGDVGTVSISETTIRGWIQSQLNQPPAVQRLRWLKLTYTAREYPSLTAEQYLSLKQSSKTSTDPNDAIMLQVDEVRQRLGFDTYEHTVWWRGPRSWRFNSSYPNNQKSKYHDVIFCETAAWQLSPGQLTVLDPNRPAPESYNLASMESQINSDVSQMVDAWLNDSLAGSPSLKEVVVNGSLWTAQLVGEQVSQEIHGHWDADSGRAFIDRTIFVKTPHPDGPGLTIEFAEWKPLPDNPGDWIAHRVTQLKPDGRKSRMLELNSISRLTEDEFRSVTQPPTPTGSDVMRGKLTVKTVYDFAKGSAVEVNQNSQAQRQIGVLPRLSDEETFWQRAGWMALAGVIAILIGMRFYRKPRN